MDYKTILGLIATAVGFTGYLFYFRDIYLGKTKPHVFSWFVWGLLTGIAFFAQIVKGAGPGAWVTGLSSALTLAIAIIAIFKGEKQITKIDWLSFLGALSGIILWKLTASPLIAIILVTLVDALGFVPTFRKAYNKPGEETIIQFLFSALKFVFGITALQSFNLTTVLYPASLILTNGSFVIMALLRRKK